MKKNINQIMNLSNFSRIKFLELINHIFALVAQLDRVPDFESGGWGFESLRARHKIIYKLSRF